MKSERKSIILLFIIGILNLCACNQEIHKPITMVYAEKVMDENPDNARRLLAGLKTDMVKKDIILIIPVGGIKYALI